MASWPMTERRVERAVSKWQGEASDSDNATARCNRGGEATIEPIPLASPIFEDSRSPG